MIKILNKKDIQEVIKLSKKYHKNEDNNSEIVANRSKEELEDLILNGYIYGKYKNNKLIGFASFSKYNLIDSIKKTNSENIVRKSKYFKENGINNENTAVLLNDLIDYDYRGEKIYKDFMLVRLEKIKELGYEHIVAYLNINKINGINDFLKNNWKFGSLIKISENRYEFLLHYKI